MSNFDYKICILNPQHVTFSPTKHKKVIYQMQILRQSFTESKCILQSSLHLTSLAMYTDKFI